MNKSLLLAGLMLLAGLANPFLPLLGAPAAASTVVNAPGHELLNLGNPCNAQGAPGGLAANPALRDLYYATANNTTIHRVRSTVTWATTCVHFTWAAGQGNAWTSLVWDPVRSVLWGARNNTADVYKISLNNACTTVCAYTPVKWFTHNQANANALAIIGNDLYVAAAGGPTFTRYPGAAALGAAPASPVRDPPVTPFAFPGGIRALANYGGSLWVLDSSNNADAYTVGGLGWTRQVWLHDMYHDTFHQHYDYAIQQPSDMAFDAPTFSPDGAIWVTQRVEYSFDYCASNCTYFVCDVYGTNENGEQYCVSGHTVDPPGDPVMVRVTALYPTLEAHRVPATPCNGPNTCPCPTPAPAFTANPPAKTVHVRGAVVDPSYVTPYPVFFRGPATFQLSVANAQNPVLWVAQDGVDILGPLATTTQTITFPATDPIWGQRGLHHLQMRIFDRATGCMATGPLVPFWVDDPTLRSFAQALRVEGNLPANAVLQTSPMDPADDLAGHEDGMVLDRTNPAPAALTAQVLPAEAEHGLLASPVQFTARARTGTELVAASVDLAALCAGATSGNPNCASLPTAAALLRGMDSDVRVDAFPLATQFASNRGFALHDAPPIALGCTDLSGLPGYAPQNGGCRVSIGAFFLELSQERVNQGPLWAERSFVPLRAGIDNGVVQAEVVLGQVYAGISLAGRGPLAGPPGAMVGTGDYGFPTDAPATPAAGPVLANGAYAGSFLGGDRADAFRVFANPGENVTIAVVPGHRVAASLEPLPTLPSTLVGVRTYQVTLTDPTGAVRNQTSATTGMLPQAFSFKADIVGHWGVRIDRLDSGVERATYGVVADVHDLPP